MQFKLGYKSFDFEKNELESQRIVDVSWDGPEPHINERMIIDGFSYIVTEVIYHHIRVDKTYNKARVRPEIMIKVEPEHQKL